MIVVRFLFVNVHQVGLATIIIFLTQPRTYEYDYRS